MKRIKLSGDGFAVEHEAGDPPRPDPLPVVDENANAVEWAKTKATKEAADAADAADATVQQLIADAQALKTTVKSAASGPLTLTKAQTLVILRGLLCVLKGDKSA